MGGGGGRSSLASSVPSPSQFVPLNDPLLDLPICAFLVAALLVCAVLRQVVVIADVHVHRAVVVRNIATDEHM